jgi:hypothetical protein
MKMVFNSNKSEVYEMPGFDGTGPLSLGPMTGWGRGYCVTSLGPHRNQFWLGGSPKYFGGHFLGRFGRGRGRGWRHWYYATGFPGWARVQYGYPLVGPMGYYYSPRGNYY